ncbi:MAG: glycosyltransferase [Ignavibacteria bacterium]|nr:glycosyltransferase [Ignavibacteria bacterium]
MGLIKEIPYISNRLGWPWTEETTPKIYKKHIKYPKISIVIPSYNQENYIEETIRSVLLQNYPNLELIIIDGGSDDGTINILNIYNKWISYWVSEKDKGQGDALNKGFKIATGDLIGWQNSDDIYLDKAFHHVAETYFKKPHSDILYGYIYHINNQSSIINKLYFAPFSFFVLKYYDINIGSQAIFFKHDVIKTYEIDSSYFFTMDAEYYFRLASNGLKFSLIPRFIGSFRIQQNSKTTNYLDISKKETNTVRRKYGVNVIDTKPWNKQFKLKKCIAILYMLPFKILNGGLFYYIKKRISLDK